MYFETFRQITKQLGQLEKWLDAAVAFAGTKKFDPAILVVARLAPDQFPFGLQVQIACDTAKLGASRLSGKEAPNHPNTQQTIEELRGRIQEVRAYLGAFSAAELEQAPTRVITQPRWEGKTMTGADYFMEHVVPNFFFHLTHAYAILRHNGIPLGKRDYLGPLTQQPAPPTAS